MSSTVILGNGLLGSELKNQTDWDILSRKVDGFDITDPTTFGMLLETFDGMAQTPKYEVVVNCIANTDTYSEDGQLHWDVNYKGVAELVDFCNKWKIKLVHISTDYIYANSTGTPSEEDVPVHQETHYAYTKLLADGYVKLKSSNYLIIRTTHKPYPFPYNKAWINQVGNFDYVTETASLVRSLINKQATGIVNVGTAMKSMHQLAKRTRTDVEPILTPEGKVPLNTSMNLDKLHNILS